MKRGVARSKRSARRQTLFEPRQGPERPCYGCGARVSFDRWMQFPQTWCSEQCRDRVRRLTADHKRERFANTELRRFLLQRDQFRCFYCKSELTDGTANMEHVIPWPKGRTRPNNLVVACRDCNKVKLATQGLRVGMGKGGRRVIQRTEGEHRGDTMRIREIVPRHTSVTPELRPQSER